MRSSIAVTSSRRELVHHAIRRDSLLRHSGPLTAAQGVHVLVCSPVRLYREGLAEVLARRPEVDRVDVATGGPQSIERERELAPDIVLFDMSDDGALRTVRRLAGGSREVRVVALGISEREPDVVACAEAGVAGFVTREQGISDLVESLMRVAAGEAHCSPRLAAALLRRVAVLAAEREGRETSPLTTRELEIAALLEEGLSNKQIAARLGIELSTVKNHVHNILGKLNARRRGEAAALLRAAAWASRISPSWSQTGPSEMARTLSP